MLYTKSQQILCRKRVSMLTSLEILYLACKLLYRPEHNAKGTPHGTDFKRSWNVNKWNISMGRAYRVDEKNGVICLVIMFTFRVMVIEMSKMADFCILLMTTKN